MKKHIAFWVLVLSLTCAVPQVSLAAATKAPHPGTPGNTTVVRASLGSLLAEFETNVKWSAVGSNWTKRRNSWLADCQKASSASQLAYLLADFESNVTWEMVENGWRKRRDSWVADCKKANSVGQVGALLLELESNVKWTAVGSGWKSRRDGWIRDVSAAR